jgi:hypothetical protein
MMRVLHSSLMIKIPVSEIVDPEARPLTPDEFKNNHVQDGFEKSPRSKACEVRGIRRTDVRPNDEG